MDRLGDGTGVQDPLNVEAKVGADPIGNGCPARAVSVVATKLHLDPVVEASAVLGYVRIGEVFALVRESLRQTQLVLSFPVGVGATIFVVTDPRFQLRNGRELACCLNARCHAVIITDERDIDNLRDDAVTQVVDDGIEVEVGGLEVRDEERTSPVSRRLGQRGTRIAPPFS